MTLIKSISGIRGTIGGQTGENLTPVDIVLFSSAYGQWVKNQTVKAKYKVVVGRDARISGEMVSNLIVSSLLALGIDVVEIGLASTPTTEIAVIEENSDGGIIITASHNPKQWNALKLLNSQGEFLNDADGKKVLEMADNKLKNLEFATVDKLGTLVKKHDFYTKLHIEKILKLPQVDVDAIKKANFSIAVDAVNSVGGTAIPELLEALGVSRICKLYCTPNGYFPHNPEPLAENLTEISDLVVKTKANLGFVVDPDVDRLAIICEDGSMFGEEYTLVAVADYILKLTPGNTVSNLSSSRALRDVTSKYGVTYTASAVGEVNVVAAMKQSKAVIGGEGNGGVIFPELHSGRDALVGIALFLTHLAKSGLSCKQLRNTYPAYFMAKQKVQLTPEIDVEKILEKLAKKYESYPVSTIDGVKIDFPTEWAHLRKSNTEPIIRIYTESISLEKANSLAENIMEVINDISQQK